MKLYTARDRIIAAYKREYADRVPIILQLGLFHAKVAGVSVKEFLTESEKMAESVIKAYEILGSDSAVIHGDMLLEAEAAGDELEFPEDAICYVRKHVLKDKSTLAKLDIPDPKRDKRLPYYLEACRRVSLALLKEAAVSGVIQGPWTTAVNMRGAEELIFDTVDDPKFVHELMQFTAELERRYGDAQREIGVGISLADPSASCSLISPDIYRKFVKPYQEEIINYFKGKKTPVTLHVCGNVDPLMEDLVATGAAAISIDGPSSLKKLVKVSQKKVVVIGNVATELFAEGTKEQIEEAVKDCIETAAAGSAYILATGCEVPLNASVERIRYFIEAGHKYGSHAL